MRKCVLFLSDIHTLKKMKSLTDMENNYKELYSMTLSWSGLLMVLTGPCSTGLLLLASVNPFRNKITASQPLHNTDKTSSCFLTCFPLPP